MMGIPLSLAEELRCQQPGQSAHRGDHHDMLTSSHAMSKAQAQSPAAKPSIDPFDVSGLLTLFTMANTLSLFYAFRVAQTRLMLLSIVHGLKPNVKLKAIWEGCANLNHLWGSTLESHVHFSKDFFLPNCVYLNLTHTHQRYATQILYRICLAPRAGQRIQSLTQISSAYTWKACTG